jgi:hypothetical protein
MSEESVDIPNDTMITNNDDVKPTPITIPDDSHNIIIATDDDRELDQITDDGDLSTTTRNVRPQPKPSISAQAKNPSFATKPVQTLNVVQKTRRRIRSCSSQLFQLIIILLCLPLFFTLYIPTGFVLCCCFKRKQKTDEYSTFELIFCWPVVLFSPTG